MSRKRRNTSSAEPESPPAQRRSVSVDSDSDASEYPDVGQRPQIDASTGQSGAFPGLGDDNEYFYGPAADGIDYLRMVRSERKDIPELLTVIQPPQEDEIDGGYWYDGAYTAQPSEEQEQQDGLSEAQRLYYDILLKRFNLIRATMKCVPPLSAIEALGPTRPISFPEGKRAAKDTWEKHLLHRAPHPVQIACMDADSVFQVIKYVTKRMAFFLRPGNDQAISRIGSWIWALLGKCPERGELGSEEISDLRCFAQRAKEAVDWMLEKNDGEPKELNHHDEVQEEEAVDEDSMMGLGDALQNDRDQESSSLETEMDLPDELVGGDREMIVDMILTVVGEVYGQRDLLDLRKPWQVETID